MQYRRTLKELCGVGRRQCGHRHPPYGDTDCTCFIVLSSESVRLTSGISRGAQVSIAPSAACRVWPHVDQLAPAFAKSALTAGTILTGIFITVVAVDRYAASSSATASM